MATEAHTEIEKSFQWDDGTVYQWGVWSTKKEMSTLIGFFVGAALLVPAILCLIFWLISFASDAVAYWIAYAFTVLFLIGLVSEIVKSWTGKKKEQIKARGEMLYFAIASIGGLFYMLNSSESHFSDGFINGVNASVGQWILFFLDNTLSVILLDIPELFDIHTSDIRHQDTASRIVTVILRLLITIGLIRLIIELYISKYSNTVVHYTVSELYWHCKSLPDSDDMVLQKSGQVMPITNMGSFVVNDFLNHFKEIAEAEEKADEANS